MPGHIKLVKGAVDPDPTEFLLPSMDMKKSDQNKVSTFLFGVWIMKYIMMWIINAEIPVTSNI